jgi:hypothetical protein
MSFYAFKYNKEKDQIELGDTGKVVASKDPNTLRMFNPNVDPSIGAKVALHVLDGLNRIHDIRFSSGEGAAKLLTESDFSEPLKQDFFHDTHTIEFSAYTETMRIKETNVMMMKRDSKTGEWVFDMGGQIPEPMLHKAFLTMHANPELKRASGEELLTALTSKPKPKLENQEYGM